MRISPNTCARSAAVSAKNGGDHDGASLSHGCTGAGFGRRRSWPPTAPASGAESSGVQGGGASPCQTAVFNTAWAGIRTQRREPALFRGSDAGLASRCSAYRLAAVTIRIGSRNRDRRPRSTLGLL